MNEGMSELTNISRPDGKDCPAYIAKPEGTPKAGLVVIQEWWGLNDQIKKTADRIAKEQGYIAIVPDLYRGKLATDADEANHLMGDLDWGGAVTDIAACVKHLKETSSLKVGVTGFCMGGALTILAALNVAEMDAGVCFYGIPPADAADPSKIDKPMQFHFATDDDWCNAEAVGALEGKLKEGKVNYALFKYEAQHAFMNEQRPEVYAPDAAKQAWGRAMAFFAEQLG